MLIILVSSDELVGNVELHYGATCSLGRLPSSSCSTTYEVAHVINMIIIGFAEHTCYTFPGRLCFHDNPGLSKLSHICVGMLISECVSFLVHSKVMGALGFCYVT